MNAINEALSRLGAHHDTPLFPPEVLANVGSKPLNTVRQWNQIVGTDDPDFQAAPRRGQRASYSYRSIATYGAAAPLIDAGVAVGTAYRAAKEWTWFDNPVGLPTKPREAIGLFEDDRTLLVYRHGFSEVVPLSSLNTIWPVTLFPESNRLTAPTLVMLDYVLKKVDIACLEFLERKP